MMVKMTPEDFAAHTFLKQQEIIAKDSAFMDLTDLKFDNIVNYWQLFEKRTEERINIQQQAPNDGHHMNQGYNVNLLDSNRENMIGNANGYQLSNAQMHDPQRINNQQVEFAPIVQNMQNMQNMQNLNN